LASNNKWDLPKCFIICPHATSLKIRSYRYQVWWHVPIISELRRLRQEDCEVKARLVCIVRPCLKTNKQIRIYSKCPITAPWMIRSVPGLVISKTEDCI
jgi:hypothetical protein